MGGGAGANARALCEMCRLVCEYEEFERKINWSEFFLAWTLPYDRMLSALRGRARSRTRQERSGAAHTRSHALEPIVSRPACQALVSQCANLSNSISLQLSGEMALAHVPSPRGVRPGPPFHLQKT